MASRPSGPPKSTVRIDYQGEIDRINRELADLEPRLRRLSRWSVLLLALGLGVSAAVTAIWFLVERVFVVWGLPAAVIALGGMGAVSFEIKAIQEKAMKLRKERREAVAALQRTPPSSGAGGGPEPT